MKIYILLALIFSSNIQAASDKKAPTIKIKSTVTKVMLLSEKNYKVDLVDYAAVYYANESILPCLQQSMKKQKEVKLVVDPKTMIIAKCD